MSYCRYHPQILVSTQVVEVSLNLDFYQGFTEPAPIDVLVQRTGRINRFTSQLQPAKVRIFEDQYSSDNKVYSEELRSRLLGALTRLAMPLSEEELNHAADRIYGNGYRGDDKIDYEDGLNYNPLKYWKENLVAGTDKEEWIREIIDDLDVREGTKELPPEPLIEEYRSPKERGRTIEANDLLACWPLETTLFI